MTNEQILELAKNCEFDFSIKWRLKGGESSNQMYWECWEQQLLKFALLIHENGYNEGYNEGYDSSTMSSKMNMWEEE
jgi:hypothetical protein